MSEPIIDNMTIPELLQEIDECGVHLTDWEVDFVDSLMKASRYSAKQVEILTRIYQTKVKKA